MRQAAKARAASGGPEGMTAAVTALCHKPFCPHPAEGEQAMAFKGLTLPDNFAQLPAFQHVVRRHQAVRAMPVAAVDIGKMLAARRAALLSLIHI